jgi:hypothetical protein
MTVYYCIMTITYHSILTLEKVGLNNHGNLPWCISNNGPRLQRQKILWTLFTNVPDMLGVCPW